MDEKLNMAVKLIHEQGQQIARMAQLIESQIAFREAHNTVIQSLIPFVSDDPEFKRILEDIHTVRLAHHLGNDVSNQFIQNYTESLNAMLPTSLKFPVESGHVVRGK